MDLVHPADCPAVFLRRNCRSAEAARAKLISARFTFSRRPSSHHPTSCPSSFRTRPLSLVHRRRTPEPWRQPRGQRRLLCLESSMTFDPPQVVRLAFQTCDLRAPLLHTPSFPDRLWGRLDRTQGDGLNWVERRPLGPRLGERDPIHVQRRHLVERRFVDKRPERI